MSRDDLIEDEVWAVEHGNLSINDCEYPEEVLDRISNSQFDQRGYIIKHNIDWERMNQNTQSNYMNNNPNVNNNSNSDNSSDGFDWDKACCGTICLILFLCWFIGILSP